MQVDEPRTEFGPISNFEGCELRMEVHYKILGPVTDLCCIAEVLDEAVFYY